MKTIFEWIFLSLEDSVFSETATKKTCFRENPKNFSQYFSKGAEGNFYIVER